MFADYLLKSNAVYDCIGSEPFSGSVAVKGNTILKVYHDGDYVDFDVSKVSHGRKTGEGDGCRRSGKARAGG